MESAQPAEPDSSGREGTRPASGQSAKPKRTRSHRALVRVLVVLASVVLLFSMIANWVQTQVLDSNQLSDQTSAILKNPDVQEQLSIFAVDQLYANVDVQAAIQQRLPSAAQPLAVPITALTRQLATNVAQKALASPEVQSLVANAVGQAQARFVNLIENKSQFVSTTGGQVTLEYGSVIADLATRLGVDPATISNIQGLVQEYSTDPAAAPDHRPDQHPGRPRKPRAGQARPAELADPAGSADAPHEHRRAADDRREPREEDQSGPDQGSRAAAEQVVRPGGAPVRPRRPPDRS